MFESFEFRPVEYVPRKQSDSGKFVILRLRQLWEKYDVLTLLYRSTERIMCVKSILL